MCKSIPHGFDISLLLLETWWVYEEQLRTQCTEDPPGLWDHWDQQWGWAWWRTPLIPAQKAEAAWTTELLLGQPRLSWKPKKQANKQENPPKPNQKTSSGGSGLSLRDKLMYWKAHEMSDFEGLLEPRSQWILDIRHWTTYTADVWFCFDLIVTMPWFFPLGIGSTLFWIFTGAQS